MHIKKFLNIHRNLFNMDNKKVKYLYNKKKSTNAKNKKPKLKKKSF